MSVSASVTDAGVVEDVARARHRGRLKIFFGAASGVGKTYAMLVDARDHRARGRDVVAGMVETHGRAEAAALLDGIEVLPPRNVERRDILLREFDLDAALARRPQLILIDNLAHSNAEDSRHLKRWNDVEELRAAGIDVFTTLNVQNLESQKDIVARLTRMRIRHSIPDTVFEQADEVMLVDLPPEDLLERLREGKVYLPPNSKRLITEYFNEGTLTALRDLALRRIGERIETQMLDRRRVQASKEGWPADERILVCIASEPVSERLIREGKRLASQMHAEWFVAYVETPRLLRLPVEARDRIMGYLRLADELGAETATLSGLRVSSEVLEFARRKGVTRIVMGRTTRFGLRRLLHGSAVDGVLSENDSFEVQLFSDDSDHGDRERGRAPAARKGELADAARAGERNGRWRGYFLALGVTALATLVSAFAARYVQHLSLLMIYLLGVVFIARRSGLGAAVFGSILSVVAFDFFFAPPLLSFEVGRADDMLAMSLMLVVAFIVSDLTADLRLQAESSRHRERRAGVLYALTADLAKAQNVADLARIAARHIGGEFGGQSALLIADAGGTLRPPEPDDDPLQYRTPDLRTAQWVFNNGKLAGRGTETMKDTQAVYFPMSGPAGPFGVLAMMPPNLRRVFLPEQRRLVDTFIGQISQTMERLRLVRETQAAKLAIEAESLRNSLLSAIAHDFRTPLASILTASSGLLHSESRLSEPETRELTETVYEEAQRMTRLANNILQMARLEGGVVTLNRDWYPVDEIVGGVLSRLGARLAGRRVETRMPEDLQLIKVDAVMIEQVIENLLENAVKYTPAGSRIEVGTEATSDAVSFWVMDEGPGLQAGQEELLFQKFYRGTMEGAHSGAGLGLTICRAIVEAHGGKILAANRPGGGASFRFSIPMTERPPQFHSEEERSAAP